jgi:hypothetical protein
MPRTVTVQALRDIRFSPPLAEGDRREFNPQEARLLVALGWVKIVNKPGRPRTKESE